MHIIQTHINIRTPTHNTLYAYNGTLHSTINAYSRRQFSSTYTMVSAIIKLIKMKHICKYESYINRFLQRQKKLMLRAD